MICQSDIADWLGENKQNDILLLISLTNFQLNCELIDWERNDTQIYCKRICILFKWKWWANSVICSRYNAAWFVGDLQDHGLLVDISMNNC